MPMISCGDGNSTQMMRYWPVHRLGPGTCRNTAKTPIYPHIPCIPLHTPGPRISPQRPPVHTTTWPVARWWCARGLGGRGCQHIWYVLTAKALNNVVGDTGAAHGHKGTGINKLVQRYTGYHKRLYHLQLSWLRRLALPLTPGHLCTHCGGGLSHLKEARARGLLALEPGAAYSCPKIDSVLRQTGHPGT